jgi:tetratricopeptide (TPR) repeat protein
LDATDEARMAFGLAPRSGRPSGGWPVPMPGSADTGVVSLVDRATDDPMRRRSVLQGAALGAVAAGDVASGGPLVRIARALTAYPLLTSAGTVDGAVPAVAKLAAAVAQAKRDYQGCRYGAALELLPGLLESVRWASEATQGDEQLRVYGLAADAYQVTGSVMLKFGDVGLAAFAADRSVEAAARSQNPLVLAASARAVVHALMSGGHTRRAKEIAAGAAARLGAQVARPDDEVLSVYGALLLRGAIAAATDEDRGGARALLDEAEDAGRRLGRDDNAHWTAFGPTNVTQHRVSVAMRLGDFGTAVELARGIDVALIPIAERKAALFLDTAQAYAHWGKHEQAYRALRMADSAAPEEVRTKAVARRMVVELAEQGPGSVRGRAREFAAQIGADL